MVEDDEESKEAPLPIKASDGRADMDSFLNQYSETFTKELE